MAPSLSFAGLDARPGATGTVNASPKYLIIGIKGRVDSAAAGHDRREAP